MTLIIILAGILGIQIIYWTILYIGLNRDQQSGKVMNVPVSVIVCAHDEEENLRELIPLLVTQVHHEYEIIIVNDCSNDGTFDFLHEESRKYPNLRIVNINHRPDHVNGKKYGLTLGIKAARYDWVLLTDADCRPSSNEWIKQMAGSFSDSASIVIGYSPYMKKKGLLNSLTRFETIVTAIQFLGLANLGAPYMATGRNLAYQKKLFLDNKGFNAHLSVAGGDDDLFVNQHGKKNNTLTVLHSKASVYSKPKKTWKEFYRQKIRHLAVGKRYKISSHLMLAPFMLSWILVWPLIAATSGTDFWPWVLGTILLRWLLMFFSIHSLGKKSGEMFEPWKIPFLDFIFCFYYLVAGFGALTTKKVQWKKI